MFMKQEHQVIFSKATESQKNHDYTEIAPQKEEMSKELQTLHKQLYKNYFGD